MPLDSSASASCASGDPEALCPLQSAYAASRRAHDARLGLDRKGGFIPPRADAADHIARTHAPKLEDKGDA